jgi:hypothetical protein
LEYDEISISKTWIDGTWMSLTRKDQVFPELRSPHDNDKCRRHSSQSSWIASEDNTRGYEVMFETFLLRVYYLNDLDDVDCKTCLFIPMQSRNNNKMLQFRV